MLHSENVCPNNLVLKDIHSSRSYSDGNEKSSTISKVRKKGGKAVSSSSCAFHKPTVPWPIDPGEPTFISDNVSHFTPQMGSWHAIEGLLKALLDSLESDRAGPFGWSQYRNTPAIM